MGVMPGFSIGRCPGAAGSVGNSAGGVSAGGEPAGFHPAPLSAGCLSPFSCRLAGFSVVLPPASRPASSFSNPADFALPPLLAAHPGTASAQVAVRFLAAVRAFSGRRGEEGFWHLGHRSAQAPAGPGGRHGGREKKMVFRIEALLDYGQAQSVCRKISASVPTTCAWCPCRIQYLTIRFFPILRTGPCSPLGPWRSRW